MKQIDRQKVVALLREMSHNDPDNRQMGAKSLAEAVERGQVVLEGGLEGQVLEAFKVQLDDANHHVMGNAIKCIADITPRLPAAQIELLFTHILTHILTPAQDTVQITKRERYGNCAGTVIHHATHQFGLALTTLFFQSVNSLLVLAPRDPRIEIILIGLITDFLHKWPFIVAQAPQTKCDKYSLAKYLLTNIVSYHSLEIVKKSEQCLSKLAFALNRKALNVLMEQSNIGIIPLLQSYARERKTDNLRKLRNLLTTLSQILRSQNQQLCHWVITIARLLSSILMIYKVPTQYNNLNEICDILDSSLLSLSYCVNFYSKTLSQSNESNPVCALAMELTDFDLEGTMGYALVQDMEIEKDEDDQQCEMEEDQEQCCRVRKSAINYLVSLMIKNNSFRLEYGSRCIHIWSTKLIQFSVIVNKAAIQAFNFLLSFVWNQNHDTPLPTEIKPNQSSTVQSILMELVPRVAVIFSNSFFDQEARMDCSRLLLKAIQAYQQQLSHPHTSQMLILLIETVQKQLNRKDQVVLLQCLVELIFQHIPLDRYKQSLFLLHQYVSLPNYKLQAVCFDAFRRFLIRLHPSIRQCEQLTLIVTRVRDKLNESDCDKETKIKAIRCVGPLLKHYYSVLTVYDLQLILCTIGNKLKMELDKIPLLEQLTQIGEDAKLLMQTIPFYDPLLISVAEFLDHANYDLQSLAITATYRIVYLLGQVLPKSTATFILAKSKALFLLGKIPTYISLLLDAWPNQFRPHAEAIVRAVDCPYVVKLVQKNIISAEDCMHVLHNATQLDKLKRISVILSKIGVSEQRLKQQLGESLWGRACLGALGYLCDHSSTPMFLSLLEANENQQLCFEAASALGNIASRQQLIPYLLEKADSSSRIFNYLVAIREMFNFKATAFGNLVYLGEWLMSKCRQSFNNQSTYYLIAECVGKAASACTLTSHKLRQFSTSDNHHQRKVLANSLRFGHEANTPQEKDEIVKVLVQLMQDSNVEVREGALRSLNARLTLSQCIPITLWQALNRNIRLDASLIITIDYGISKEKKDLGKNLRLQSYILLQSIMKSTPSEMIPSFVDSILHGLRDETNSDILLRRLKVLKLYFERDEKYIDKIKEQIRGELELRNGIFRHECNIESKKPIEDERLLLHIRSVLKEIVEIDRLARKQEVDHIETILAQYRTNPILLPLITQIEQEKK